ncbi:hypothetical protein STENM327S_04252 [Streptomyces tendae]
MEGEASPVGVSVSVPVPQVTENATAFDVVRTGVRTSTRTALSNAPLSSCVVTTTPSWRERSPPDGKVSVRHPGSETDPSAVTQR